MSTLNELPTVGGTVDARFVSKTRPQLRALSTCFGSQDVYSIRTSLSHHGIPKVSHLCNKVRSCISVHESVYLPALGNEIQCNRSPVPPRADVSNALRGEGVGVDGPCSTALR